MSFINCRDRDHVETNLDFRAFVVLLICYRDKLRLTPRPSKDTKCVILLLKWYCSKHKKLRIWHLSCRKLKQKLFFRQEPKESLWWSPPTSTMPKLTQSSPAFVLPGQKLKPFTARSVFFVKKKNIYIKECLNVEKLLSFNLKIVSNVQIMFTFLFQLSPAHQRGHHQCGKDDEETDQKIFRSLNSFFCILFYFIYNFVSPSK